MPADDEMLSENNGINEHNELNVFANSNFEFPSNIRPQKELGLFLAALETFGHQTLFSGSIRDALRNAFTAILTKVTEITTQTSINQISFVQRY